MGITMVVKEVEEEEEGYMTTRATTGSTNRLRPRIDACYNVTTARPPR